MTTRRLLGLLFVLAAFFFLGLFVSRDLEALRSYAWEVDGFLLLASLLLQIAGLLVGVAAWQLLLRFLGFPTPFPALARIWFVSGLGRYIPGKVWQFVGAAQLGGSAGLPALVTVTSLAAHTFFFLVGAVLVAAYLTPFSALGLPDAYATAVRLGAPLLILLVHPALLRRVLRLMGRLSRRDVGEWTGSWSAALSVVALSTVSWAITGVALYLFIRSVASIEPAALAGVIGSNALAFVAGYLVFVAPAGLGAKEGALAALLSIYLPLPVAALVAVLARLWTVASEVLPAAALFTLSGTRRPPMASETPPNP